MHRSCFVSGVFVVVCGASLLVAACSAKSNQGFAGNDGTSASSTGSSSGSGASGAGNGSGSGGTTASSSSGSRGSASGGTSSSGAHSGSGGSGTSSGSASGGSTSSSGVILDASLDVAPPPPYDGGPQQCGSQSCDLKTSTCCVAQDPASSTCVAHGASCPFLTAAFSCLASIDCPSGQVCCGVASSTSASTGCQTVASGQACSPPTNAANNTGSAQLCISSAECTMGQPCIPQTCLSGSHLTLCGLHDTAPFNCTAM